MKLAAKKGRSNGVFVAHYNIWIYLVVSLASWNMPSSYPLFINVKTVIKNSSQKNNQLITHKIKKTQQTQSQT
jgi:hypothetical protein